MSSTYMRPAEWLSVVRQEYLQNFIRDGGAAVKFIVPTEEINHGGLKQGLRSVAEAEGYQFVWVDAATTRVHRASSLLTNAPKRSGGPPAAFMP